VLAGTASFAWTLAGSAPLLAPDDRPAPLLGLPLLGLLRGNPRSRGLLPVAVRLAHAEDRPLACSGAPVFSVRP
jgi:hypothetical protein